jgi:uncharacterized protein with PIN domain
MAQVNKISSFKSFTEVKNQETTMKLRETNNAKRQETVGKIGAILDEMGLTSLSELDEEKKQALINKMFGNVSEDEAEDIEDKLNKLGEPKKLEEGNAFIFAASKAKQDGKSSFEFNGKTYKVTLKKDTGLSESEKNEGNEFGAAVKKAKEDDEDEFEVDGKTYKVEEALNEGKHGMAKKLLKGIVDGDSSEAEGIKLSKDLAEHYLNWINTSPFGKKNENLPLNMLIKASFVWGIERQLDPKLKVELETLKGSIKESVESIDEARSIAKIQYDWSKLTTSMQATAQNWKAAEGSAKESLLGKLKEMTAQKKALEAELDATIADKDKDLELVVSESKEADEASNILDDLLDERGGDMEELHGMSIEDALDTVETYGHSGAKAKKIAKELFGMCNEAFSRLPKDVIGNELYLASKNLTNLFNSANTGNDIDTGVVDSIVKQLNTVKKSVKKFNNAEEVAGTVYEGKAKDLKPNHKYTSDYGEVTFIKLNPDGKTMKLHSKETGDIKTDISNAYNMELIESVVNEGTKQFDKDIQTLIKDIKSGYGWIDPEYVGDTWENSNNTIDYSLVKGEVLKRLFDAGLLAHADENDEEVAGKKVKFSELGAYANESIVNEAEKFKSTKDFLDFLEEIDGMPENRIKRIMGKNYIDTPGGFRDEADDYDNDIEDYMIANMGRMELGKLHDWWENNVQESTVVESGFRHSDPSTAATHKAEQLKRLKKLRDHREETDRIKKAQLKRAKAAGSAKESVVAEGKDDYMARSGNADINIKKGYKHLVEYELDELYNKLGALSKEYKIKGITATFESIVNEAEVSSDGEFKEYAMSVLKKAFGDDFDEAKAGEVVDGILKKCGDDYGAAIGMLTSSLGESVVTEAFDANYWEDYHEGGESGKIKNPGNFQIQQEVEVCVEDWNDNNEDGADNEVTSAGEKKVLKLAKDFAKAKGWISSDVIDAMIAQES